MQFLFKKKFLIPILNQFLIWSAMDLFIICFYLNKKRVVKIQVQDGI